MRHSIDRMTAAELRALRESMGLSVRALAAALGMTERTVGRWESGQERPSRRSAAALSRLRDHTEAAVARIAAEGEIVTYRTDEDFHVAEPPGDWVLPASWHRMVAWRAAQAIPGAVIRYRGHD